MYDYESQPEWARKLQTEYRFTGSNLEAGEQMIRERMEEAVQKPMEEATEEIRHILNMAVLSDPAIIIAMEIAAQKNIYEVDAALGDIYPSEKVLAKGIELLGQHGMLFAIIHHAHEHIVEKEPGKEPRSMRKIKRFPSGFDNNDRGIVAEQAEKSILEAVDTLSGGKPMPGGITLVDSPQISEFLFVSKSFLSDRLKIEIIEVLAKNECFDPIAGIEANVWESKTAREVARKTLMALQVPTDTLDSMQAFRRLKVVDEKTLTRPKGPLKKPKLVN
ncbi:hypothetical protein KKE92_05085 [Candidatus Micrarchaeota archaeon]|nr:hypothetical protein [Candidatus Micrarchaeota archaeon]MBU1681628.1 hypothetical protein [Candidatus Micrarchaeota archaeon]